jgi:hypothetical protein
MMDYEALNRLVWETYPFPIAYAYKRTIEELKSDDELYKLKYLCETAESPVRFLALLTVAQVQQDALHDKLPQHGKFKIKIENPTFGRWQYIPYGIMKTYRRVREQLAMPELFDVCGEKSRVQTQIITPLRNIRNHFAHGLIPESQFGQKAAEALERLRQLIEATQFLVQYHLAFVEKVTVEKDVAHQKNEYTHELRVFNGCFTPFGKGRWKAEVNLPSHLMALIRDERYLLLDPFVIFTNQLKGLPDLFVLINFSGQKPVYASVQSGETVSSENPEWKEGKLQQKKLRQFFQKLRRSGTPDAIQRDQMEEQVLTSMEKLRKMVAQQGIDLHISDKIPDYIVDQAIKSKQDIDECYEDFFNQPFMQRLQSGQLEGFQIVTAALVGEDIRFIKRTVDEDQGF